MYNAARFIKDCIDSVLSQSFQDLELLVVDDGSTDNSCDIVNSVRDNRIRLIRNQHDYVGSLNKLLDEAKGKYIARMDADDVMYPNRLASTINYCGPTTPTTPTTPTIGPSASPTPTVTTMCIGF